MTLDPKIKEHLEYFGFDTTNPAAVDSLTLNPIIKTIIGSYFNSTSWAIIENYKPLVAALNWFCDEMAIGEKKSRSILMTAKVHIFTVMVSST